MDFPRDDRAGGTNREIWDLEKQIWHFRRAFSEEAIVSEKFLKASISTKQVFAINKGKHFQI